MARFRKILRIVLLLVPIGVLALAIALSHEAPCGAAPALAAGATPMKAVVHRCYGAPDVLSLEAVAKPVPGPEQVLVKVRAAALNPLDWHVVRGRPYVMRLDAGIGAPSDPWVGVDYAGVVEAVGKDVTKFKPGDEVFGGRNGALAEYVLVRESRNIVPKPSNISFEQAAALPVAAITALQSLRDAGRLEAGEKVLINGASGGVGTYAVQIAKALGAAEVTGVCSARNAELVKSLGADRVIDYKTEDFTQGPERYDLIVDMVGNLGLLRARRALTPEGRMVIIGGGGPDGKWIEPFSGAIKAMFLRPFVKQQIGFMLADINPTDLKLLADWMASGKMQSIIDRSYPLGEAREALRYLEDGHARGKVILRMD